MVRLKNSNIKITHKHKIILANIYIYIYTHIHSPLTSASPMSCWCAESRQAHALPRGQCCCYRDWCERVGASEHSKGTLALLHGISLILSINILVVQSVVITIYSHVLTIKTISRRLFSLFL